MTKQEILEILKSKKDEYKNKFGIVNLGLYGSFARDEAQDDSDIDIFYERDSSVDINSGLEFLNITDELAKELKVKKIDFVNLEYMNPLIKIYAKKDFIYVGK